MPEKGDFEISLISIIVLPMQTNALTFFAFFSASQNGAKNHFKIKMYFAKMNAACKISMLILK